jgi:hypothetical protein
MKRKRKKTSAKNTELEKLISEFVRSWEQGRLRLGKLPIFSKRGGRFSHG